jgi:hypothetical protein
MSRERGRSTTDVVQALEIPRVKSRGGYEMLNRAVIPFLAFIAITMGLPEVGNGDSGEGRRQFVGTIDKVEMASMPTEVGLVSVGPFVTLVEHPGKQFTVKHADAVKWGLLIEQPDAPPWRRFMPAGQGRKVRLVTAGKGEKAYDSRTGELTSYDVISLENLEPRGSKTIQARVSGIVVVVNGRHLPDYPPALERGGRILLPMRTVFEALEASVTWQEATGTVTAVRESTKVQMTIGSTRAYINGSPATLGVPPRLIGGATYIPVRFPAEAFGADVGWDAASKTVTITLASRQKGAPAR